MKQIVTMLLILILLTSACSNSNSTQTQDQLEAAIIIPLTGAASSVGEDFLNGMLLAKEELKSNVLLHIEDSQTNPKEALNAAKKILESKNIDVLVSVMSITANVITPLAEQYNIPQIASVVSDDDFTEKSINNFRLFTRASEDAKLAAEFASRQKLKLSTLTILDDYGKSIKEHFKSNFKGKLLHEEEYLPQNTDFKTSLTKISGSDAIYFAGYPPHYINLLKQRKELGSNITLISNVVLGSRLMRVNAGKIIGSAYATVPKSMLDNEKSKEFDSKYESKYSKKPDWSASYGYDMMLVLDAVSKSEKGKQKKDQKSALYKIRVDGLNGEIKFDSSRESNIPLFVAKVNEEGLKVVE